MLGVAVVYLGLVAMGAGALSILKPLRWLRIADRKRAALVFAAGVVLFLAGAALPAPLVRVAKPESQLDAFMPAYQFHEFHALRVRASRDEVYRAIREVTADEIFLFRTLTWIRHPRLAGRRPESILNPPEKKPILDVALASGFRLLAEQPNREIVLGTTVLADGGPRFTTPEEFRSFTRPGNALATINFRVEDNGDGTCTVSTETRVFATDDRARHIFARYWRVIYPGSSLLRHTWLRAIRKRAEAAAGASR